MKKRIVSIILALVLCFSLPAGTVLAADQGTTQSFAANQNFSNWAMNDLVTGDTYGIYPLTWYTKDMTKPITKGKLNVLIGGLRLKLLDTGCVADYKDRIVRINSKLTVQEVMKTLYDITCDFTFNPDLKLQKTGYKEFMKANGIYTGKNGEQSLQDKCSIEQACVIATRLITVIYDKLDAGSKGFFYKTEANGNTVYMLGSIHMADNSIYPMDKEILKAYNASDALAVEIDMTNQTGVYEILNLATYTDGTTLKDHVSKETYEKVVKFAAAYGYKEELIKLYKPWYLYISFTSLAATDTASTEEASQSAMLGIDNNFLAQAVLSGKQILEVEGYGVQAKMLDSFSDGLEEYLLNTTIDSVNEITSQTGEGDSDDLQEMLELWRKGDEKEFLKYTSFEYENEALLTDSTNAVEVALMKEFQEKLYTIRDKNMAEYIHKLLTSNEKKTYFVVVGSGHYVSDHDVIDLLTEKGYTITQIK